MNEAEQLRTALAQGGDRSIVFEGHKLHFRFKQGIEDRLVILFHGAIDRTRGQPPRFQPLIPALAGVHQMSIADPSVHRANDLAAAWYAGDSVCATQTVLTRFISAVTETLRVKRRVYVGGSSGGFACLYFSRQDAGSVAVAANPQIDLSSYGRVRVVEHYQRTAWPDEPSLDSLSKRVTLNVAPLYAKPFANSVIYLQSSGDRHHLQVQLREFLAQLNDGSKRGRFILNAGFWGRLGHSGSAPASAYVPWVHAALASPSINADDILNTYHQLSGHADAQPAQPAESVAHHLAADVRMADYLRDLQLQP